VDELGRLKESITRHAGEGLTHSALPGVSVICSPTTTEPLGDMVEPTLAVIAQGVKQTALNGRPFTYGAGQFLIVSVQLPVIGHIVQASVDEPFLAFVLKLRGADRGAASGDGGGANRRQACREHPRWDRGERRVPCAARRDRPTARAPRRA
jgi:hypothetical protein